MRIAKERIESIKRSVDLKALVEAKGIELKKNGKGWFGLCPFHDVESVEVKDVISRLSRYDQPIFELRNTSRGPLKVRALRVPVYIWEEETGAVHRYFLVATQTLNRNPETKISLSNLPETVDLETLAWMQLQRYWVERAFEDTKSECGMADYQVRKRSAWHHHMALVMMTMLFILSEKIKHADTYPLLSCSDIEELLSRFLPCRDVTKEEIIQQLEHRHRKHLATIQSHSRIYQKQAVEGAPI